jgi:toluene monooxygenase system protein E
MRAYRDQSPLTADAWESFRDPDCLTYRAYVTAQHEQESVVGGVLEQFASVGTDATYDPAWRATLGRLFTASRYPVHGAQQVQSYLALMAPTPYISNPAALSAADMLRRVTLIAYRTRELQIAWPEDGFATGERAIWEDDAAWQPARQAIELALTAYDWAESFTAMNLVLLPTLDNVLLRQFGALAKDNGDALTWMLTSFLLRDVERRERWSGALARFAVDRNPANEAVLARWIDRWTPRADEAAHALGTLFETLPARTVSADQVAATAAEARSRFLAESGVDGPGAEAAAG